MGDTKVKQLHRGFALTRIILAVSAGVFFMVASLQLLFFQNIKVSFQTGTDAQQISTIKMKKGAKVDLPTPLKPGSYFLGWSLSPDSAEILKDSSELMRDTTLYAVWDGSEKYAVLSVAGINFKEVNIFDTSVDGLTATALNQDWRVLDDYAKDNTRLASFSGMKIDPYNNFSRFLGWQYLNAYNTYNDLLYTQDETGKSGTWTWVQRDENGNVIQETEINETNKFYPPNYRTTFTALLDYRIVNIQLFDQGASNNYDTLTVKLGAEHVTMPVFGGENQNAHFSHWKIRKGQLKNYALGSENTELAQMLSNVKERYEAGEVIDVLDPLWYYYGSKLISPDGRREPQVYLSFEAVYWNDTTVPQYSIQTFTDLDSGSTYENFGDLRYDDLSLENPVAYDPEGSLWLYNDSRILSYAFYDHQGTYHILNTDNFTSGHHQSIPMNVTGSSIYLKGEWGVNVMVNYQTSATDVTVKFKYGNGLYLLPDYYHVDNPVTTMISKIGNTFEILTSEKYLKPNHIFTGWKMVGDSSGRIYYAGEKYTIPNFDTRTQSTMIEFVAVWHLQRLLFEFDFDGGNWATENGPDFTLMKGGYGNRVKIVREAPVKFGYDFVGWTLENGTEMLQPNDYVVVGTKFQTLHAHWTPRRLHVYFHRKWDNDEWLDYGDTNLDINNETLYAGGSIELLPLSDNDWYFANGWQIGNQVVSGSSCTLTTQVLSQLKTNVIQDGDDLILEVDIYAAQSKRTLTVEYDFMVGDVGNYVDISRNVIYANLPTTLAQGELFYDYYPFAENLVNYNMFDTHGSKFLYWSYYTTNANEDVRITPETRVPAGTSKITVIGNLSESKTFTVSFYNHNAEWLYTDPTVYYYTNSIELPNSGVQVANNVDEWGTFVGWSFERDHKSGNPEIIYDVKHFNLQHGENPQLQLLNANNTSNAPYSIDVDCYAVPTSNNLEYTLELYAVYTTNYATVTYAGFKNPNNSNGSIENAYQLPVYSNGDYTQTKFGGRTVGYDSDAFATYGVVTLDDDNLRVWDSVNFIGWKVNESSLVGVNDTIKSQFVNRIWFAGEYLPSLDFNFKFEPILVNHSQQVQEVQVGNRTYRVLSLGNVPSNYVFNGSVDVVALPRGNYTIKTNGFVINSNREVHIVVPADNDSQITLQPRAIRCDTIKEFYVGDNLTVTGSPVVGANFQAYRVKKGYQVIENDVISAVLNPSVKYDFTASLSGLLVGQNGTLYGVPSHTTLTTESLLTFIINQPVTCIASYALSDVNNLNVINLAKSSNLQIQANAIYNVTANQIILPASTENDDSLNVDAQALSGALTNLTAVTFGNATTTSTWYAFVDHGFVYYVDSLAMPSTKAHVMYVLRTVELRLLNDYTHLNDLKFDDNVSMIEPSALMGLNWNNIQSITANNEQVDLTVLLGVPNDIPLFTSAANQHKGPMIQPYKKTFRFTYREGQTVYESIDVQYVYGQTFRVFDAQNNAYRNFDRAWSKFVAWKCDGEWFRVGEVYKVGIDSAILGDKYIVQFDASSQYSWNTYPVQFVTFNDAYSANDFVFQDIDGAQHQIADLLNNALDLSNLYLPGLDQHFQLGNAYYQFIGWTTKQMNTSLATPSLWNNLSAAERILPNHTFESMLDRGTMNSEHIYVYYALYEKVTPTLEYELLPNNTYAITRISNTNVDNLYIPFAKYCADYMLPVSKINQNVFAGITSNTGAALNEIVIGGAISEIGDYAFNNVKVNQITFNHQGRDIYYNYRNTTTYQLKIGKYAFANNSVITAVQLPAVVESLDDGAFASCINLYRLNFADTKVSPRLRRLGDFVFRGNKSMRVNDIVSLLINDGKNGDNRFVDNGVGNGIFMDTSIETDDYRIVWRDTLLYVYYKDGAPKNLTFTQKIIAGYAFTDLGSDTDNTVSITIKFTNSDVKIKPYAFSNLHHSVKTIDLKGSNIQRNNVDDNAFDDTIDTDITVQVDDWTQWILKYKSLLQITDHIHFI